MKRAAVFCPGRGSYTKRTMGTLPPDHPWTREAEELRGARGLPSLLELDGAAAFEADRHLAAEHVSPLIYLRTLLDLEGIGERFDVVCVGGNSLGWYTSLAAAGALGFGEGLRLVQTIAQLQAHHQTGGQIVYPVTDDDWGPDAEKKDAVSEALRKTAGQAYLSIDLGGHAVLAGTEDGIRGLEESLPKIEAGSGVFPYRLRSHGAYHTPLLAPVALAARTELERLAFSRPEFVLIDGRGGRHTPWSAEPAELRDYTLGDQITTPFEFAACVRVALREYAPDCLVLPGPGTSLVNVCGRILAAEGYRGIRSRQDFEAVQAGSNPVCVVGNAGPD